MRIIVIDDSESIRDIFKMLLEIEGHEVLTANNGEEGIKMIGEKIGIDVVITDGQMPKKRGEEVTRYAKLNHPGLKVIFLTSDIELKGVALAAGADSFLLKKQGMVPSVMSVIERFVEEKKEVC
ncbi:MAG: response regulator [Patescibacteria group bacterium]